MSHYVGDYLYGYKDTEGKIWYSWGNAESITAIHYFTDSLTPAAGDTCLQFYSDYNRDAFDLRDKHEVVLVEPDAIGTSFVEVDGVYRIRKRSSQYYYEDYLRSSNFDMNLNIMYTPLSTLTLDAPLYKSTGDANGFNIQQISSDSFDIKPPVRRLNVENWTYTVDDDDNVIITGYSGSDTSITIPDLED